MFDNLREMGNSLFDDEPKEPKKKKMVLRFRWPIRYKRDFSDDPLQDKLAEYLEWGGVASLEDIVLTPGERQETAYLVRVFVQDAEGKEYVVGIPEFLKTFNKELRQKSR